MGLEKGFVEPIEGYLSTKEKFNGVLFILREPNADNQNSFWFRDCLVNDKPNGNFTRYKKAFEILLTYCDGTPKLIDCAYANIRPRNGKNTISKSYKNLDDNSKSQRIISIVEYCNPKFVFVCTDMFNTLLMRNIVSLSCDGVAYNNKQMRKLVLDNGITVFEMYHPSYWRASYPNEKKN